MKPYKYLHGAKPALVISGVDHIFQWRIMRICSLVGPIIYIGWLLYNGRAWQSLNSKFSMTLPNDKLLLIGELNDCLHCFFLCACWIWERCRIERIMPCGIQYIVMGTYCILEAICQVTGSSLYKLHASPDSAQSPHYRTARLMCHAHNRCPSLGITSNASSQLLQPGKTSYLEWTNCF